MIFNWVNCIIRMDQKQIHVLSYGRVVKRIVEEEWEKTIKKGQQQQQKGCGEGRREEEREKLIDWEEDTEEKAGVINTSTPCFLSKVCSSKNEIRRFCWTFIPNSVLCFFNPSWSLPFTWIFPQKPGYVASVYSHGSLCHRWCNVAKYSISGCVLDFLLFFFLLSSPLSV